MSNDHAPVIPLETENPEDVVEKRSFFQKKVVAPIKKHPKLATAIAGGVALVAGAAYLGRATAPSVDVTSDDSVEIETHEDGSFTVRSTEED